MSKINDFNDYTSKYNTHADYSYLFGATQTASASGTFSLADYASIKNGSYGKLLRAYYAKQDAENSNAKDVLRNVVWMTGITESNENLLSKISINVGKGNNMELDEEMLKKAEL